MKTRFAKKCGAVAFALALWTSSGVSAQTVTSFTLVNADTGADIKTFTDTGAVDLAQTPRVNIRANTIGAKSVVFATNGIPSRTENSKPFAYFGNVAVRYHPWSPAAGEYLISARPFSEAKGTGLSLSSAMLRLQVFNSSLPNRHAFEKTEGPDKNPLKGWTASWNDNFPEASVGFQYVPWKEFEPENNVFNHKAVESRIARAGSVGRHLVLRFFAQWKGDPIEKLAAPKWLFEQQGVRLLNGALKETGKPFIMVDFNDSNYVREAQELIQEIAARYDGDPRIYAIELGILGFWGEWHTHDFIMGGSRVKLTPEAMQAVADTYKASFSNKRLMARYPEQEPLSSLGGIGFHNDFFKANDKHGDGFSLMIEQTSKWKDGPIGGEAPPLKDDEASALYPLIGSDMIETGHYSIMKPGKYRRVEGQPYHDEYMRLHRRMGYNFQIDEAWFPNNTVKRTRIPVTLNGTNVGIAPFYYDWDVELALLNEVDEPIAVTKVLTQLSAFMPNQKFQFATLLNVGNDIAEGNYKMAVRIIQPSAAAAKSSPWKLDATNVCVQFANELEYVQPVWNEQNELQGGWSILHDVTVHR